MGKSGLVIEWYTYYIRSQSTIPVSGQWLVLGFGVGNRELGLMLGLRPIRGSGLGAGFWIGVKSGSDRGLGLKVETRVSDKNETQMGC